MFADFDFGVIERSWRYLFLDGMAFTLKLTVLASIGALVLGTILAMIRISAPRIFALPVIGYVNLIRSLPFLLVIFWFYFLVPYIAQWVTGSASPVRVGAFYSTLITFIIFEGAFFSEIMRSGIQSIPKGQVSAGYAMGMNYYQVMWHVVLPQAFRNMIPALLTQTIVLFQDTALVYVLSLTDFLGAASKVAQRDGRLVEMYIFAALVYFTISFAASLLVKHLARRTAVIR